MRGHSFSRGAGAYFLGALHHNPSYFDNQGNGGWIVLGRHWVHGCILYHPGNSISRRFIKQSTKYVETQRQLMMIMMMCTIIINDNGTVVELVTFYSPMSDLYLVLHLMVVGLTVWLLVMMMGMMIDNMVIKNSTCPPWRWLVRPFGLL